MRNALDRLATIEAGAPIAERGFYLDAQALLGDASGRVFLGARAAALTVLPGDVAVLGAGRHGDMRGMLSLGMRFR